MRARWLLPVVPWLWLGSGCGGSASETPFPLEPDFQRLRAKAAAVEARDEPLVRARGEGGSSAVEPEILDSSPSAPPPTTWGTSTPKRPTR